MAWAINGTPTTLGSAGDDLDITDLTARKFNQFLLHAIKDSGNIVSRNTFNNNTNSVYTNRRATNGNITQAATGQANLAYDTNLGTSNDIFMVQYVCSISDEDKIMIAFFSNTGTPGDANAPERVEYAAKFVPSPDATITRLDFNNTSAGNYGISSNVSALGTD